VKIVNTKFPGHELTVEQSMVLSGGLYIGTGGNGVHLPREAVGRLLRTLLDAFPSAAAVEDVTFTGGL
jgi:hypothetical protein